MAYLQPNMGSLGRYLCAKLTNIMNQSKLLITGATGLSGSILLQELVRQQIPVRALIRNRAKARELERYPDIEVYEGDMLQPDTLRAALDGVEKAVLISSAFENMVNTQQTFIDAAVQAGVRQIIKYSGAEAGIGFNAQNFQPTRQHENIEDYLIGSGVGWTIVRPSQFMEVYLPGSPTGVDPQRNALVLPIQAARLVPVSIEDVAKVITKLLVETGHDGKIYEMTGPDALTMPEACAIVSEVIGRPITYVNITMEAYQQGLVGAGVPEEIVAHLINLSKERRKCTDANVRLTTHQLFGIRPTNFAQFIYKHASAFQAN